MESTQKKNYKFGNVVREEEESVDETYERLLSKCCADFNHFTQQLHAVRWSLFSFYTMIEKSELCGHHTLQYICRATSTRYY